MAPDLVRLNNGYLELALNHSVGGSIASFEWLGEGGRHHPLMRGCHSGASKVLEAASLP